LFYLNSGDIIDVVAGEPGPKSDINLFRQRQTEFDPNQWFNGKSGINGRAKTIEQGVFNPTYFGRAYNSSG
jgi:hypothetical protein